MSYPLDDRSLVPPRGIEPRPNGLKVRHAAITPQRPFTTPLDMERQAGVEPASPWFEAKCLESIRPLTL